MAVELKEAGQQYSRPLSEEECVAEFINSIQHNMTKDECELYLNNVIQERYCLIKNNNYQKPENAFTVARHSAHHEAWKKSGIFFRMAMTQSDVLEIEKTVDKTPIIVLNNGKMSYIAKGVIHELTIQQDFYDLMIFFFYDIIFQHFIFPIQYHFLINVFQILILKL